MKKVSKTADFGPFVRDMHSLEEDQELISAENHEKSMVFIEFLDDATRSCQTKTVTRSKCIEAPAANFIAPEHA